MRFGQKKKENRVGAEKYRLSLYDADGNEVFCDLIQRLPLPESLILACSEEFFNDPDPCELHRRAAAMRLYGEMLDGLPLDRTLAVNGLPPRIALCLRDLKPSRLRLERAET